MPSIPDSPRFVPWSTLMIFTAICLGSVVDNSSKVNKDKQETWIIAACAIVMSFSIIMVFSHFIGSLSSTCIGQKPEGAIIIICTALWCAATATLMRPANDLAVAGPVIINANLYFSGWAALAVSVYLLGSYMEETRIIDTEAIRGNVTRTPRMVYWMALIAASIIVMASSADMHGSVCSIAELGRLFTGACPKVNYAISYGVIGSFFSILAVFGKMTGRASLAMETILAILLFVFYVVGVAVVTGVGGPGSLVGNLYFSSWIGFLLTVLLCIECIKELMFGGAAAAGAQEEESGNPDPEVPIENEEDDV